MTMITIASLFDRQSSKQTGRVWDLLENECNLTGIRSIPYPHFSWLTGADFSNILFDDPLVDLSNQINVFEIKTTGLGIFTGESPVIYLPLVKTQKLLTYHQIIWEMMETRVAELNSYYSPENWIPHITIGYGDVTIDRLSCAVRNLTKYDLSLTITIDNISYLSRIEEEAKIERIVKLKGEPCL